MPAKNKGYLVLHEEVEMTLRGLTVRAYTKRGKFLGRVDINRAGLQAYIGKKANRMLGNMSWSSYLSVLKNSVLRTLAAGSK